MAHDTVRGVLSWLALCLSPLAGACLVIAALYTPEAVAQGQHLADLGLPVRTCPGCALCGLSRAFAWSMRGELETALHLNPLVLVAFPLAWLTAVGGPLAVFARTRLHRRNL